MLDLSNSGFEDGANAPHSQARKPFEFTTQFVIPALSLALAGVTALSGKPVVIVRYFISGAVAFTLLGFAPAALSRTRLWLERRKDKRVARLGSRNSSSLSSVSVPL